ncbi:MAG TPA: cytochrome c [Steroidobacteraceae bacterium]|nr:cytochrome c [Steroidobacteraceae bacterium]
MTGAAVAQSVRQGQDFALLERGRYLAVAADCTACHTNPDDGRPFAGGRPIQTPFGTMIAPNITPDQQTGIGGWSDAQFDAALRRGVMPSGARLYPAMPYLYYTRLSAADVRALHAYLETVAPVRHAVAPDQLPFPFDIRFAMKIWDALYFHPGPFKPDPSQSAEWNRGAYLVEGPGHCQACHTPKTFLAADETGRAFQGYTTQGWFAPDITEDARRGLAAWTVADIVDYLKSGHNRLAAASGPMAEEVADSSSRMTLPDLTAIATYLKERTGHGAAPAATPNAPVAAGDARMVAGAAIYQDLCSACHRPDGSGVAYLIPNLARSDAVASRRLDTLLRVVLEGAQSVATTAEPTGPSMPGYRAQLSDAQVAAVLTYIRNSWGHAAAAVSPGEVRQARARLASPGHE